MKENIKNAILDMSRKIERDSKHVYRDPITGDMYQGVSTVSSIVPKDWLAAWGAKEAVKFLGFTDYKNDVENLNQMLLKIKNSSAEQYLEILREAKGASGRKSKKAMVDGKAGHQWLEDLVKARINGKKDPEIPFNTPLERPIKQFLEWDFNMVDYWIASEALVVNPEKRYAGQLDAIAVLKTGELTLCDFKFSSHIDPDYWLQTAGYAACFEPYNIRFDKRLIIRLPKTVEREEWNTKEFKYEMKPNDIEPFVVPTLYEVDRNAFFNALPLKSWINMVLKLTNKK